MSKHNPGGVSEARLHQHSGAENAFGGYTKVAFENGTYAMFPTED